MRLLLLAILACPALSQAYSVTLQVDMKQESVSPQGVHIAGNFQSEAGFGADWNPASTEMSDSDGDGIYSATLDIPSGIWEFKFVNGNTWSGAENAPATCTVGATFNRTVQVPTQNLVVPTVVFNQCPSIPMDTTYTLHWWNDAVFYEIFVRSFQDSDNDGKGDFQGIIQRLDYLTSLGVTGLWLMPMMESPSYHGYDVSDYYATEPDYGTLQDFQELLDSCHQRGIKVIIDLVMNHSSNQNDWFVWSRNKQNGYRDWYRWSATKPNQTGPWGQNVWHAYMGEYYYGIFYDGMPDINYENPDAQEAMMKVAEYWMNLGADGYRLDAIKYLDEDSLVIENTPETFEVIRHLNQRLSAIDNEHFTVGEVWDYTEKIIPYVSDSLLKSCFEFDLAGCIQRAVQEGKASVIHNQIQKMETLYPRMQYSTFLTNHDQDRLFSNLNDEAQNKQCASILLELPGIPFLYYGEEIGMTGTGDHLNIRTPMQWSPESGAGFTSGKAWRSPNGDYTNKNVELQEADSASLWNHYRHSIAMRHRYEALRKGYYLPADCDNESMLAYARVWNGEALMALHNLSNSSQSATPSWSASTLTQGNYTIFEANTHAVVGSCSIDAKGALKNWNLTNPLLAARGNRLLILSQANWAQTAEPTKASSFMAYPNPCQEGTRIQIPESGTLRVYNSYGQLLFSETVEAGSVWESTTWTPGPYFLHLETANETYALRLLVLNQR